ATATGLRLTPTLVFDYPTAATVVGYLHTELFGADDPTEDLSEASAADLFAILDAELATLDD
ncbi:hypothetical protein C7C46_33435, partial [Streptomyces tateyamensis]